MTVSIVTQTSVRPGCGEEFARWQGETSSAIAALPGFVEQRLLPPNPPLQVDWVILQRFERLADAQRWLASPQRQQRLEVVAPLLLGRDDVHIVQDDASAARTAPVSAVISTRVKPGMEAEYLKWEQKIAAAQSRRPACRATGSSRQCRACRKTSSRSCASTARPNSTPGSHSPERRELVEEAAPLTAEFHTRTVQSGFEQWFRDATPPGAPPPAAWKLNMIVLLTLYPVVFLWSVWFGLPILAAKLQLNLALALFIGNVFSVSVTAFLVPWTAKYVLAWWFPSSPAGSSRTSALGAVAVLAAYAAMVFVFWKFF